MAKKGKYAKDVARKLCSEGRQFRLVLTAVTAAAQERLGEDIILWTREKGTYAKEAVVYNCKFHWKGREIWQHVIFYGMPESDPPRVKELLRITLDIAHELGHLVLERGPGIMPARIGVSQNDLNIIREVEADWFAVCVLQMYGFIFPPVEKKLQT